MATPGIVVTVRIRRGRESAPASVPSPLAIVAERVSPRRAFVSYGRIPYLFASDWQTHRDSHLAKLW